MINAQRSYGLPAAMLRHAIVFALAAGAIIAQGVLLDVSLEQQLVSWMAVAVGVGVVSALIAPGVVGLVFVFAGSIVGLLVIFVARLGTAAGVSSALGSVGILYFEIIEVAALAYLLTAIAISRLRR